MICNLLYFTGRVFLGRCAESMAMNVCAPHKNANLTFSHRYCRKCRSSGLLHCVTG